MAEKNGGGGAAGRGRFRRAAEARSQRSAGRGQRAGPGERRRNRAAPPDPRARPSPGRGSDRVPENPGGAGGGAGSRRSPSFLPPSVEGPAGRPSRPVPSRPAASLSL
ncbi:unnamed protein product [Coccothraustes coccothraustes]